MKENDIIERIQFILKFKNSGDIYTKEDLDAIKGLVDLYNNMIDENNSDDIEYDINKRLNTIFWMS